MKINANLIRPGNILDHNGQQWGVLKIQIVQPGKGGAFIQVEMRNVRTGTKTNERWRTADTVERLQVEEKDCTFLFGDADQLTFMDAESFEQFTVSRELVGEPGAFLQDGMPCTVDLIEGLPVSVTLPDKITMRVAEADPVVKGQTAASSYKPGILENGVRVLIPPFVEAGTRIVVNTADATYVERAKIDVVVRSPLINVMDAAARKAARGLIRDFGEVEHLQVSKKGPGDFVSAADHRVEKVLLQELKKARPEFGFLFEEQGAVPGADPRTLWVIDPLDGTTNFLHGIPHFAISIGLVRDGEPVAGVIYQPLTDEMFTAEKGSGAFVNERRLRVSARRQLDTAVVATGIPHNGRPGAERFLQQLPKMMEATAGIRRLGSAALDLAYVAAGRYEGFWEIGLQPWDIAAGIILVREAGGYVSDLDDGHANVMESGNILAANDQLHAPLAALLGGSV